MLLGRVIGEVWTTRRAAALRPDKLLVVAPRCSLGLPHDTDHLVALDKLGAGVGDEVVVCLGAPPRWQHGGDSLPVEAAVMAIVDRSEVTHADPALPFAFTDAGGAR